MVRGGHHEPPVAQSARVETRACPRRLSAPKRDCRQCVNLLAFLESLKCNAEEVRSDLKGIRFDSESVKLDKSPILIEKVQV